MDLLMTLPPFRHPRLFGVDDVAKQLSVSVKTIRRWVESGELRAHRLGRLLRVSQEDLNAFLSQRRE